MGRGTIGIGCGFPGIGKPVTNYEKTDVCPICNIHVAISDKDKVQFNGQAYHLSELTKPGARQNGAAHVFKPLSDYYEVFKKKEDLTFEERQELKQLKRLLEAK